MEEDPEFCGIVADTVEDHHGILGIQKHLETKGNAAEDVLYAVHTKNKELGLVSNVSDGDPDRKIKPNLISDGDPYEVSTIGEHLETSGDDVKGSAAEDLLCAAHNINYKDQAVDVSDGDPDKRIMYNLISDGDPYEVTAFGEDPKIDGVVATNDIDVEGSAVEDLLCAARFNNDKDLVDDVNVYDGMIIHNLISDGDPYEVRTIGKDLEIYEEVANVDQDKDRETHEHTLVAVESKDNNVEDLLCAAYINLGPGTG